MDALFKKIRESGIVWFVVLVALSAYGLGKTFSEVGNRAEKTDVAVALNTKAIADDHTAQAEATKAQTKAMDALTASVTDLVKNQAVQAKATEMHDKATDKRLDSIESALLQRK